MNDVHVLDLAIIVGYLLLITVVGLRLSRRIQDARDFFLAGRSLGFGIIGLSIIGTHVSAQSYVGAAGGAFNYGIAQASFEWIGAIPAMILAALIFIPVYWRAGVYSIPEYLGLRYTQGVRVFAALIACVFSVFAIAVAFWAIAVTLEIYLGWPMWLGILVTGSVVGLYSIAGGLAAVTFTDALQVLIMFVGGLAILWIGLGEVGGLTAFSEALTREHPQHLDAYLAADHPHFPWVGVILGLAFVMSPAYWCGNQAILQRTLAARSEWDAKASMMFAAFATTLLPLLIVFPGLLALVMGAEIAYPDAALPWVIKHVLPAGLSGLVFVAIIAALQSSLDSSLNSTSLLITRDLRGVLMPGRRPERDLAVGRLWTLLILLAGMAGAPLIGDLSDVFFSLQVLLSLFQGPTMALLLCGILSRWATPAAGMITLLAGLTLSTALTMIGMNMLYVALSSFVFSLAVIISVSRHTPRLPDSMLNRLVFRRG